MRQQPGTPAELFEQMQYSPIDWPWKTTRLRRDTVQDVRQRLGSAHPAIAELYHRNSSLFPARARELPAQWLDTDAVRLEFLRRQASLVPATPPADAERFQLVRPLLDNALRDGRTQLCYAMELRLSDPSGLFRYEPLSGRIQALHGVTQQQSRDVTDALTRSTRGKVSTSEALPSEQLFIIASFPRNEVLYGSRGYRRTLMEAGRVIEALVAEAGRQRLAVRVSLEFFDGVVNAFVGADGVEEATLAVLEFGDSSD